MLTKLLVWGAASAAGIAAFAAVVGSQVLPPDVESDCAGQVPIVVASDAAAQSDLYSAATLAGVLDTTCIVLAGARDAEMGAEQVARLDAALPEGWVMGGEAAVPAEKIAERNLKRLNGVDRWHTARLAGAVAVDPDGDIAELTEATAPAEDEVGGGSVLVDDVEVRLPPGLDAPCDGQVPIVVAVDADAQADLYSAATLAGVLDTTCYVLAGARGEPMPAEQQARLAAAESDGYIVGGEAAVPPDKVAGHQLTRQGGADRWETARLIGETAVTQAAAQATTTTTTERRRVSTGGGSRGGGTTRRPTTRAPTRAPTGTTAPPRTATPFTPSITVSVPQLAGTATGTNIWAGETFEVTIARDAASAQTAGCDAATEVIVTFTVGDDGTVTPDATQMPSELVGTLADGTTACGYEVTFPVAPTDVDGGRFDWTMTPAAPSTAPLSDASPTASIDYEVGVVTFDPEADIAVPPSTVENTAFTADLASTQTGCDDETLTYLVEADGVGSDGVTVAPDPANPSLVAYPAGADATTAVCAYAVEFAETEDGGTTLELQDGADTEVTGTDQVIRAIYLPPVAEGSFRPSITLSVPRLAGTAMGTNIWADETFEVTLARTSGTTHAGCSLATAATATYTVQDNGDVTTADTALRATLVSATAGGATTCEYEVTFPAAPTDVDGGRFDWTMTPAAATTATLNEENPTASVDYEVGVVTFEPDATITVPAGTTEGVTFTADFTSSTAGCVDQSWTYAVGPSDTVAPDTTATNPALVAYPAGADETTGVCDYAVAFAETEDGAATFAVQPAPAASTTVSGISQDITATYGSGFEPSITLSVPPLAGTTDGATLATNIWAGETFEVTLARASGTTQAGCSLTIDATVRFTVDDTGSVTPDATQMPSVLVDTPAGSTTTCEYEVTFGAAPLDADDDFDWTMAPSTPTTVPLSEANPTASVTYTVGVVAFDPDVTINVPAGNADKSFEVAFASTQPGCDDETLSYAVTNAAAATATAATANPSLVAYPMGAGASTSVCSYTVTFPLNEETTTTLTRQTSETATVSGAAQEVSADYTTGFEPSASVSVPQLDGTTTDTNIWAGATFEVSFARASGTTGDCSLATAVTATFTVQPDGSVTDDGMVPAALIGTLADDTTCEYEVTFGAAPTDADADFDWTMTPATTTTATLNEANPTASVDYSVGVVTFEPDATITVPAGTTEGVTFTADFTSSAAGCVDQSWTYAVGPSDTVAPDTTATNPALVAYPAGATTSDDVCTYAVDFLPTEVGGDTLSLATSSMSVSGTSQAITASYTEPVTGSMFSPDVKVRVPFVDDGGNNALDGGTIRVRYRPVTGSHDGCRTAIETFTVQQAGTAFSGGLANPSATRPQLINVPTDAGSTPCEYLADFDNEFSQGTEGPFAIQQGDNAQLSATSEQTVVAYASGSVLFPEIAIYVMQVNHPANDPATTVDETTVNLFEGYTFPLTVTATDGPGGLTAGCSGGGAAIAATHTVAADGTVSFNADGPMLIDTPDGETDGCVYRVSFPAAATRPAGATDLLNGYDAVDVEIDAGFAYAFREYRRDATTSITATINVVGSADGTVWEFDVAPVNPATDHCSPQRRIRATTGATASGVLDHDVTLALRPVDGANDCTYTLTWPTSEVGGTTYARVAAEQSTPTATITTTASFSARYVTTFAPMASVTVPRLDGTTAGENIWAGETFRVRFARDPGAHPDCSLASEVTVTFTVQPDGEVTDDGMVPTTLLATLADGTTCAYTVVFSAAPTVGANSELTWAMTTPTTVTLSRTNPSATGAYTVGAVTFSPDATITVPTGEGHATKTFDVTFASTQPGCVDQTWTYEVQSDDTVLPDTDATNSPLVAYPAGAAATSEACSYAVTFGRTENDGTTLLRKDADPTPTATVRGASQAIVVEYETAPLATTFDPSITVSVPLLDGVTPGENIWKDASLTVTIERTSGAHRGCSLMMPAMLTYTVSDTGAVTTADTVPTGLVGTLGDGTMCEYSVRYGAAPTVGANAELSWMLTVPVADTLSAVETSAVGDYTAGEVTFVPDATITVAAGNDGAALHVSFTATPAACTDRTLVYDIGAGAAVMPAATNVALVAYPAGASAASELCVYDVMFPLTEHGGTALARQPSSSTTASAQMQAIAASYGTPFTPSISASVPPRDRTGPSTNIWAGETFVVTIARNAMSAAFGGCDAPVALEVTFTVGNDGVMTADAAQMPSTLIGTTAAAQTCGYDVTFPAPPDDADDMELSWMLTAPAADTLSGAKTSAVGDYTVGEITFVPDVTIIVPAGHAGLGKTFRVSFTSPQAACTDRVLEYEILTGSAVTPAATNMPLVAYPDDAAATLCSYTVAFPLTEHEGDTLALQGNPSTLLSVPSQAITVEYAPDVMGSTADAPTPFSPVFEDVSVGEKFACGRQTEGTVTCWGRNRHGETNAPAESFEQVAAGRFHTCAIKSSDDTLECWGWEAGGANNVPSAQAAVAFEQIVAGDVHTCGRKADGSVVCWGWDDDRAGRLSVPAGTTFSSISASFDHTCGIRSGGAVDGTVVCWGHDVYDQSTVPAEHTSTTFSQVSAGQQHTCAVRSDGASAGAIVCWGSNAFGRRTVPPAETASTFTAVSAGYEHTCALKDDSSVVCWGNDALGEATAPTGSFSAIDAGMAETCGVRSDGPLAGSITCWGFGNSGRATPPAGSFEALDAGNEHTCGVRSGGASAGTVVCWGENSAGQSTGPAGTFASVSAGGEHSCGVRSDGVFDDRVVCWGADGLGQASYPSVRLEAVSAGDQHTCGVRSGGTPSGTVVCWGSDADGRSTLPPAEASSTFTAVAAGGAHACGVKSDNSIVCWGDDGAGRATPPEGSFTAVAAGRLHTCALAADETLECWGDGSSGRTFEPSGTFSALSVGRDHSCAVATDDGSLRCWGYDGSPTDGRVSDAPSGSFSAVAAGAEHSCAVTDDARVLCWGYDGSTSEGHDGRVSDAPSTRSFAQVVAGAVHSCALRTNGSVTCWGDNRAGQSTDPAGTFVAISAGSNHSCGVRSSGAVECWGDDGQGQATYPSMPFLSVSAGWTHTCGVRLDEAGGTPGGSPGDTSGGTVTCWGSNVASSSTVPSDETSTVFASVSAGTNYTCAVKSADGAVVCWGDDGGGRATPPSGAFSVVSGGFEHTCGLRADGTLACWGNDKDGKTTPPSGTFSALAAGRFHTCALAIDGTVACWGANSDGETEAPAGIFTAITAGDGQSCGLRVDGAVVCWGAGTAWQSVRGPVAEVAAGETYSCALRVNGSVFCWGDDADGQLAAPEGTFSAVSAGPTHVCALGADGTVECWGDAANDKTTVPDLTGALTFTEVSVGGEHACGLVSDGTVECWGEDSFDKLVAPAGAFRALSAGQSFSCGIRSGGATDGTLQCWGRNQLSQATPPTVGSFVAVSAGEGHACAVASDGSVECWGDNSDGQTDAPEGTFVSLTAGRSHTCGVTTGQTVVCWGSAADRQTAAPAGLFRTASAGATHTCGVRPNGVVACWGFGNEGQADAPARPFSALSAGSWHTCGVRVDDAVECWGQAVEGQTTVPALSVGETFAQVSAGRLHTCGVRSGGASDNSVRCWGSDGSPADGRVLGVPTSGSFTQVAAGGEHSCALASDGTVECWGNPADDRLVVSALGDGETYTFVDAGDSHTCGMTSDGSVECWGDSDDGRSTAPSEAADVFASLSVGEAHACAVREADGSVACWGIDDAGQSTAPTEAFSAVAAGAQHTCALRSGGASAGTIACWGSNAAGQLEAPSGMFVSLTAGAFHTCGVRADDSVTCWGAGTPWLRITGLPPTSP